MATLIAGCTAQVPQASAPPQVEPAPEARIDRYSLALVIHKSRQTLSVYRYGVIVQEYAAVFGQQPLGNKLYEGDLRTPEGLYRIERKREHARWRYFLALDYPNERDRQRYQQNLDEGRVPVIHGKSLTMGDGIGIHGSDRPAAQSAGTHWTRGCIALTNNDIAKVYEMVKPGTPVLILP